MYRMEMKQRRNMLPQQTKAGYGLPPEKGYSNVFRIANPTLAMSP
jgi:hypothetical protein